MKITLLQYDSRSLVWAPPTVSVIQPPPAWLCVQVSVCVDVVSAERRDAPGGEMAVPSMPRSAVEGLQLTDHGHGGLLLLLLDQ